MLRWIVRYLSFCGGILAAIFVAWIAFNVAVALVESFTPLTVVFQTMGEEGYSRAFMGLVFALPAIVGGLGGLVPFRTISRFGWEKPARWRHLFIGWGLASGALWFFSFTVMRGYVTPYEAWFFWIFLLMTFGFGWHLISQYRSQRPTFAKVDSEAFD